MGHMLEVNNLQYYYGNIRALHGISFHVDEGETVTLIGSNGAGKTTTLQTISGLTDSKGVRGEIVFCGQRISGLSGHAITRLGISQVLEGRRIFPQLTVPENLRMGAFLTKDKAGIEKQIETEIYKLFPRLEERKHQLGGTLSGGEQQMLAIGRALMNRPRLLLLDEPSMGLAPVVVQEIFEAVRRIRNEGMTVLFVEQNAKAALNTGDRGYVMQVGEIVLEDTCENLKVRDEVKKAYLGG